MAKVSVFTRRIRPDCRPHGLNKYLRHGSPDLERVSGAVSRPSRPRPLTLSGSLSDCLLKSRVRLNIGVRRHAKLDHFGLPVVLSPVEIGDRKYGSPRNN